MGKVKLKKVRLEFRKNWRGVGRKWTGKENNAQLRDFYFLHP